MHMRRAAHPLAVLPLALALGLVLGLGAAPGSAATAPGETAPGETASGETASGETASELTETPSAAPADRRAPSLRVRTIERGLDIPWDLTFLPGGAMLYTQRDRLTIR